MEDIRPPRPTARRDYALPQPNGQAPVRPIPVTTSGYDGLSAVPPAPGQAYQEPAPAPATPVPHFAPAQPPPRQTYEPPPVPHRQPNTYDPLPAPYAPAPRPAPQAVGPTAAKRRRLPKPLVAIITVLLASALFAGGYSLKSADASEGIPNKIIKQVSYELYFPSPMPAGYTYMKDTATFQIGQVFYKFSNGNKRVTVKEEPLPQPRPDLSLYKGYAVYTSAVGKTAIGLTFGQPTAIVLAGSTVITLNTSGSVSQDELKTAIDNLKNIGKNTDKH